MASVPKASTPLLKICLFLIAAINIAAASRRSVLADLYKQAAEQNRPLILVVDNHSKNEGQAHQNHGKHDSDETPFHYLYPKAVASSPAKSVNAQEKNADKDSKQNLLKYYLSRLLQQHRGGLKKKAGRSDDRDDNRDYYRDDRDQRGRRDRYRERDRNVDVQYRDDRDRDSKYNRKPADRYYYRPRESREYKSRSKYYNRPEDRDRHDRDRYDRDRRDRYRSEKNRDDRDRVDRYRSEKDRVDTYWQDRNKGKDYDKLKDWYRDDRDRYQYQSQQKYQRPRSKDRYSEEYGANVLKNLLRISNDLNCDAKYDCKNSCQRIARMLRQNGGGNCEDLCDVEYDCAESKEKEVVKVPKKENRDDECDARGSEESCGEGKTNGNISTRGPTIDEEEDECGLGNGDDHRC